MDEQRKRFLDVGSTHGEDTMKTVEMTKKDLEDYISLVDKVVAEFESTASNFEKFNYG